MAAKEGVRAGSGLAQPKAVHQGGGHESDAMRVGKRGHQDQKSKQ